MARPTKAGLDYFPLDVGFFGDKNIRILKARYRSDGIAVYIKLLCDIYKDGYFLSVENWDDYIFVIADEVGASVDKVEQIITFLRSRAMVRVFEKHELTGYEWDAVITSHGIQKRYAEAMKSRKKSVSEVKRDFWLLSDEEETQINAFYKSAKNSGFSEINPHFSENNPVLSEINPTNKSKLLCTDVPHAREFFQEFPAVALSDNADLSGIDFLRLAAAFRASKKFLQTRTCFSWVREHYSDIVAGKYSDFAEPAKPDTPANVSPAVSAANARSDREKWYADRKNRAESRARAARDTAERVPVFLQAEQALRALDIEQAKAELKGNADTLQDICQKRQALNVARLHGLQLAGIAPDELTPRYFCSKCNDSGFLPDGRACDCYRLAHT